MAQYQPFYEKYPKVFDGCLRPDFDFKMLEFMLQNRERIRDNAEAVNEVDADVIGVLKEKYVNPVLKSLNIPTDQEPSDEIKKNFEDAMQEANNNPRAQAFMQALNGLKL